jgi:hypothetical protein
MAKSLSNQTSIFLAPRPIIDRLEIEARDSGDEPQTSTTIAQIKIENKIGKVNNNSTSKQRDKTSGRKNKKLVRLFVSLFVFSKWTDETALPSQLDDILATPTGVAPDSSVSLPGQHLGSSSGYHPDKPMGPEDGEAPRKEGDNNEAAGVAPHPTS